MKQERCFGTLLHPTSLPGPHGIGSIGGPAHTFIDILKHMGASIWQFLPLQPPGSGNSPYSADSVFANNPLLIDLENLVERDLLPSEILPAAEQKLDRVDYETVLKQKTRCFRHAFDRFMKNGGLEENEYREYLAKNSFWLDDYALFKVIQSRAGSYWLEWPESLKFREDDALKRIREAHRQQLHYHCFIQFIFSDQWHRLKRVAGEAGVLLIGDIPIFTALNAADVWAHPECFQLDDTLNPVAVAGVPPDYFSATGQRWGNPLYNWNRLEEDDFEWWVRRFSKALEHVDVLRIDHFRGFEKYWSIPVSETTAVHGEWKPGPGAAFFDKLKNVLGELPVIAEDLGVITPDVEALRDRYQFPGMKILQFAFGGDSDNPYLPHQHIRRCVVYTGTHDNNTTRGWWEAMETGEQDAVRQHMEAIQGHPADNPVGDLLRMCLGSVADWAVVPVQDLLDLGADARINTPSTAFGNWSWRLPDYDALISRCSDIRGQLALFNRLDSRSN